MIPRLMFAEDQLLREAADRRIGRAGVALTYALAIMSRENVDWAKVNAAIMSRWSRSALEWIKKEAWKRVNVKQCPEAK